MLLCVAYYDSFSRSREFMLLTYDYHVSYWSMQCGSYWNKYF